MKTSVAIAISLYAVSSTVASAATCKDYRSCREAVIAWCEGKHPRADGDKDGIPCENVCNSRAQVEKIQKEIGYRK